MTAPSTPWPRPTSRIPAATPTSCSRTVRASPGTGTRTCSCPTWRSRVPTSIRRASRSTASPSSRSTSTQSTRTRPDPRVRPHQSLPADRLPPMTSRLANLLGPVLRATTLVALLAAVGAGAVNAHPGGPEEIIVVGDHVDPGQAFQVLAAFIEPGVDVPITVVTGSTVFDLGSVSVDAAGRFNA